MSAIGIEVNGKAMSPSALDSSTAQALKTILHSGVRLNQLQLGGGITAHLFPDGDGREFLPMSTVKVLGDLVWSNNGVVSRLQITGGEYPLLLLRAICGLEHWQCKMRGDRGFFTLDRMKAREGAKEPEMYGVPKLRALGSLRVR